MRQLCREVAGKNLPEWYLFHISSIRNSQTIGATKTILSSNIAKYSEITEKDY